MRVEKDVALTENVEQKLDEADESAEASCLRLSHAEVFDGVRKVLRP